MSVTKQDIDETARLILMDEPGGSRDFLGAMRREIPGVELVEILELWRKYRGLDSQPPTHDIQTGRPIRPPPPPCPRTPEGTTDEHDEELPDSPGPQPRQGAHPRLPLLGSRGFDSVAVGAGPDERRDPAGGPSGWRGNQGLPRLQADR